MIKPILYTMWIIAVSLLVLGALFIIFMEIIKIDPITVTYWDESQIRMEYATPTATKTPIPFPTLIQVGQLYDMETRESLTVKTTPTPDLVKLTKENTVCSINGASIVSFKTDPYIYPYQLVFTSKIKGCSIAFEDAVFPIKMIKQYFDGSKYVFVFERQYDIDKKGKRNDSTRKN